MPFDLHQPPDDADERHLGPDADLRSQLPSKAFGAKKRLEVQAQPDDVESLGSADFHIEQVLSDSRGDGDQPSRDTSQRPLDSNERARACCGKVPAEDVAVKRMDDDWNAREKRRQSSQRAGLGRMRVHDVRPFVSHQSNQSLEHDCVANRELTAELGQSCEVGQAEATQSQEIPLGRSLGADHQPGLVFRRIELGRERRRMNGGTSYVQARNNAQDLDFPWHLDPACNSEGSV